MNTKTDGEYTCICNHLKKSNITDITDVIEAPCRAHLVPIPLSLSEVTTALNLDSHV